MEKNYLDYIYMDESDLAKLSKTDLIKLVLSLKANQPRIYKPRPPIPTPRRSVKQMAQEYEENIIAPPPEFRDDYKPTPLPRTKKPVPLLRTKIEEANKALKGYTRSFNISIKNSKDPLLQLQNTRKAIENHINSLLPLC